MANLFGTLNRFISRLDSDPNAALQAGGNRPSQSSQQGGTSNHYGFQILRNTNPTTLPLEPWFDFIIGINGHNIDNPDPQLFITEVRNCAGSTISLGVFGAKGSAIREVYVSVPPADAPLGIALQWAPLSGSEDVWHILDVMPNSPADVAGLLPYSDYVIGSPEGLLHGDGGLGGLVERFMNSPLRLYVYNQEYDVCRMVTIVPAKNWGGEGALGCVLGYGALHRIPAPLTEGPAAGPGETLFSTDDQNSHNASLPPTQPDATPQGGDFFVPANNMTSPSPGGPPPASAAATGPPPMGAGKPRKARAHHTPASVLDDYFAEGEQKSRELEGSSPTPKTTGGLPPPPKAGSGLPKASSPAPPAATEKEGDEAEDAA
ncbi:related to GRH1-Yeast (GR)ASP65 (H)omologue [Lecanosticta acicola]|uniref:Related to GRH1-Yeast (GR)ASP65 (H)omologue n=1 Tax=Lecanosticta acicola TaxID=111012 RepID=A0AAI9EDV1_9PEZI|nr:related to GRH1-Yeast (GR)ASP65 (H)omologue [Lecanosticta acicola]